MSFDVGYDRSGMLKDYAAWREKGLAALSAVSWRGAVKARRVYCAAMGASAAPAEVFRDCFPGAGLCVVESHMLPADAGKGDAFVACSLSGNTQETLLALRSALERGMPAVGISGGGKIAEVCAGGGVPHVRMPKMLTSRSSFPIIASTMAAVLSQLAPLPSLVDGLRLWFEGPASDDARSKELATWMHGASHLTIYHSPLAPSLGRRFRNVLSENAKARTTVTDIMDVQHDGICSWEADSGSKLMLLPGPADDEVISGRFEAVGDVVRSLGFDVRLLKFGGTGLGYMLDAIYFLDLASIHLALLRKLDPGATRSQELVRRRMEAGAQRKV
ncbi:MAG: hypothetical protein JRN39_05185 [Nitrososphaerota archaeon]|nr:hypothetical protein [Nitrososphaerota archaeon]MDG6939779.1 hypothetical protein [Nitrososphaerota archaeon]